jgi:hypothetical protein
VGDDDREVFFFPSKIHPQMENGINTIDTGIGFMPVKYYRGYEIGINPETHQPIIRNSYGRQVQDYRQNSGYRQINLSRPELVHRLVAKHYIKNDNPRYKTVVNHINGNREDNRPENLEWVTPRANSQYRTHNKYGPIHYIDDGDMEELALKVVPILSYNGHEFPNLFYDLEDEVFYDHVDGVGRYKVCPWRPNVSGHDVCSFRDTQGHPVVISKNALYAKLLEEESIDETP